jgi:hypothetical protein
MGEGFQCHERCPGDSRGAAIHCRLCGANEGQCKVPCGCLCATKRKGRENPFFPMLKRALELP